MTFFFQTAIAQPEEEPEKDHPHYEALKTYEDTLSLMAFVVVNDSIPENRFAATHKLITTLVKALKIENSFDYPFERLKSVSIQYAPDNSFRIFTWHLFVDNNTYRYYGAIQMNSPELILHPLRDRSHEVDDKEHEILSSDKWFGSVYYNMKEFDSPEGKKYLLFGFNGMSFFNKRKIAEVLSFKNGKPVFGAPVFAHQQGQMSRPHFKNRLVLEYSAEVSVTLNYNEQMELVIFDHLVTANGTSGQGPTQVPDGSYEAYKLQEGYWVHIDKVFDQVSEEAPRPQPILDQTRAKGNKDLFGRKRND